MGIMASCEMKRKATVLWSNEMKNKTAWRLYNATILALAFSLGSNSVIADFVTFSNGLGSKWGDPLKGTQSDIITWSFMDDLTSLSANHPLIKEVVGGVAADSNISALRTSFNQANGVGSFDQAVQNAATRQFERELVKVRLF